MARLRDKNSKPHLADHDTPARSGRVSYDYV